MNTIKAWLRQRKQKASVLRDLARLFSISVEEMQTIWKAFDRFYRGHCYAQTLGEKKTLNQLESFVTYVMLAAQRPASILEIGTFYGKSTRRILDMKSALRLDAPVTCYDISNDVTFFNPEEARMILADITPDPTKYLSSHPTPRFIFLDARPYHLLKNVVTSYLKDLPDTIMTIHDCSPLLCHREMKLDRSCLEISSVTGVWERHVLAECFHVSDPLSRDLDDVTMPTHRLIIFGTEHGLALLVPQQQIHVLSARVRDLAAQ